MGRKRKSIHHNRLLKFSIIIVIILVLLIGRLIHIQLIKSDEYKMAALRQRGVEFKLYPDRGTIYDRNLIPLTNKDRITTSYHDNDMLKDFLIHGKILRYDKNNLLTHVIGYINRSENKGEYGIEKVFDDILKFNDQYSIFLEMDNKRKIIPGAGFAVVDNKKSSYPNGVKLTIDYHIQKIVEMEMDKNNINGAVVVAEVKSGDIVAMASRPNFVQDNIDAYLDKDNMELYNKAIQVSYPPGSLFKVVVLLAALEEDPNIVDKVFYCKGYDTINDVTIRCNKANGHGYISLMNAFSKSCNSIFIQIGQNIGSEKIIDMAKRLGYGEKINIGLLEETTGRLPTGQELIGPSIGNISIGQGKIEVTPLQVTNMMLILANNGVKKDLSIIKGIINDEGYLVKDFKRNEDESIISSDTAKIVRDYLREVVKSGTGSSMDLEEIGGACGKTGSAQAVLNGENTIHGWFSGFFPENNPKYVITIFVEEANSGSKSAVPIFENIAKEIYVKNR